MTHPLLGLHHVTATVGEAQPDLDFYADSLGLRLVKRTVNFDNHNVYHFYYGDERGTPGTIWTTFPYAGWGVPVGRKGEGQLTVTSFSVPASSLDGWLARLGERGIVARPATGAFGNEALAFSDPSGLAIELVATERDLRTPWSGNGLDPAMAIRGLESVTMTVADPAPTLAFMTGVLGFEVVNEAEGRIRVAVNGDEPGKAVEILHGTGAGRAMNGLGTVHHVAFAIGTGEQQLLLREELVERGHAVTEVRDRQYFQSIYFREPGGVLFEVATVQPGFAVDEPLSELGRGLKLPWWEERYREEIEARLPPIVTPLPASRAG
ncbi:MAG TPA: ring-cleaving dioxygenase [Gemmatimonadales bacterium]|nr:ring-cleaving dioxygenase [Gemmatimonadales bacterium]